jgi:hypothetical protein
MIYSDKIFKTATVIGVIILFASLFDDALAIGVLVLAVLLGATSLVIKKKLISDKFLFWALITTIFIHLVVVLFIYYADFQPLGEGEGDYATYNSQAQYLAQSLRHGDFSGLGVEHLPEYGTSYYPVVIGSVYAITAPSMLVGQLFSAWLAVVLALLVYLLVIEIGGTKVQAFFAVLLMNFYPSHLFYCSLLLKDTLVIPLSIASLLLTVKLIKNFSWQKFLIFYLIMIALTHFRFYVGYVAAIAFITCWFLFSSIELRKKIGYVFIMIFLLGFLPQISGYGYFGINTFRSYFSKEAITNFRQDVYMPDVQTTPTTTVAINTVLPSSQNPQKGSGSSFVAKTDFKNPLSFISNYAESYMYVLLGPFPWQMVLKRQMFALFETIPWYFLLFFVIKGIIDSVKRYKVILPLLLFSIILFAVLGLYTPNFGIITRIRMPGFIILFCFAPFGFSRSFIDWANGLINKIGDYLGKKNVTKDLAKS